MSGPAWWQRGAIYQIYPRSFADGDGDGVGDLGGLIAQLDYLADLGIEGVWLSPIYPSPMADFGYDVADFCDVDPTFGSLAALHPPPVGRLRLRGGRLLRRRPPLGQPGRPRPADRSLPRPRHPAGPGLGAQPHLRPPSLVCRLTIYPP